MDRPLEHMGGISAKSVGAAVPVHNERHLLPVFRGGLQVAIDTLPPRLELWQVNDGMARLSRSSSQEGGFPCAGGLRAEHDVP